MLIDGPVQLFFVVLGIAILWHALEYLFTHWNGPTLDSSELQPLPLPDGTLLGDPEYHSCTTTSVFCDQGCTRRKSADDLCAHHTKVQ